MARPTGDTVAHGSLPAPACRGAAPGIARPATVSMTSPVHSSELAAAAYHEAGHAVMCHLMRLRIASVSIGIEDLNGGQTTHGNKFRRTKPFSVDTPRGRMQVEKIIMLCFAGPLAQQKFLPRGPDADYGDAIDVDMASTLAMRVFRSRRVAAAYVNFAREWVRQKLEDPRVWAAVERLALALMRQRQISGRHAEAIIRGKLGSAPP